MKTRLLRKLRNRGRNAITIYSISTTFMWEGEVITGMSYSYTGKEYADLFRMGDTPDAVREKACKIWLAKNIDWIRRRYKKYTRIHKYGDPKISEHLRELMKPISKRLKNQYDLD